MSTENMKQFFYKSNSQKNINFSTIFYFFEMLEYIKHAADVIFRPAILPLMFGSVMLNIPPH